MTGTPSPSDSASAAAAAGAGADTSFFLYHAIQGAVVVYALYHCCATAYEIRLQSIQEFGPVIHEFDPYFNFRATEVSVVCCVCYCIMLLCTRILSYLLTVHALN